MRRRALLDVDGQLESLLQWRMSRRIVLPCRYDDTSAVWQLDGVLCWWCGMADSGIVGILLDGIDAIDAI